MRNLFIAAMLLLTGSLTTEMVAQDAIAAVVKKCESQKDVDIHKARSRDKDSKEVTREVTTITIKNNPSLANEFIAAFNKDKANALDEAESSANGKVTHLFYRFDNVSYSYLLSDDGNVMISVMSGEGTNMRYFGGVKAPATPRAADRAVGRTETPAKEKTK